MKRKNWDGVRINVALTAGVMATVMIALVMMQLDALQAERPQIGRLVIANVQATAVADGAQINLPFVAPPEEVAQVDSNATVVPDSNPRTSGTEDGDTADFPVCGEVPAGWLLYTTGSGDTVALLAAAIQADPNAILAANCLTADNLVEGMQILLPGEPAAVQCGPPQNWVRYQVQVGDTMAALAGSRGTSVADVLRANCRDSEALTAGQMIFLPAGGAIAPPPATAPPNVAPPVVTPPAVSTATPVPPATSVPTQAPPNPTPVPPVVPTNIPIPTLVIPTIPIVPTAIRPTATPPFGFTATPPVLPTLPSTAVPPTSVPPTSTSPAPTATSLRPTATTLPPTSVPPTPVPPTATVPLPPTNTPLPPPTNTPPPPPTTVPPTAPPPTAVPPTSEPPTAVPPTSEPPPTDTPEPPPPDTPVPEPSATPPPSPALVWYGLNVWLRYWR